MDWLYSICLVVSAIAFFWAYLCHGIDKKGATIALIIAIVALVLAIVFFVIAVSDGSSSGSSWDKLSKEEKEWYVRNYGNGQYDKYQNAINDYKGN